MGARSPSHPKDVAGVGTVGNLMQEMFSKTSLAKSPQVLLTSSVGVRWWAQLGRALWPEGSLAQPRPACIAAAQVRLGAWSHSFKQMVLVRGLDHTMLLTMHRCSHLKCNRNCSLTNRHQFCLSNKHLSSLNRSNWSCLNRRLNWQSIGALAKPPLHLPPLISY